jgi:hypothetical protein
MQRMISGAEVSSHFPPHVSDCRFGGVEGRGDALDQLINYLVC